MVLQCGEFCVAADDVLLTSSFQNYSQAACSENPEFRKQISHVPNLQESWTSNLRQ